MPSTSDVLICGGGVIGLTCAYELAKAGRGVVVLDRGEPARQASWAGAGMLPPAAPSQSAEYSRMMRDSHDLWPGLSAELRERTGLDNGFRECGAVAVHADDAARDAAVLAWRECGADCRPLDTVALREVELHADEQAGSWLHVPQAWQVRNPRHLKALLVAVRDLGVQVVAGDPAEWLIRDGDRVIGAKSPMEEYYAAETVVACGAWSTPLLAGLTEEPLAVRPVRGQIVLLNSPVPLRGIVEEGPRYLVPRGDGRVLVGSTVENAGFDARPTAEGLRGLLELAERLCPALREAHVERHWAGLRPASVSGRPLVGRVEGVNGLLAATGHFRDGLNLSPLTGRLIAEAVG